VRGGLAIGPAASVRQALSLIEADGIQGAILDVNLPDGDIGPVLRALSSKENAPVVIHTGVGLPDKLKAEFPDVPVYIKPTSPTELAYHLARKMNESAR
jgi:DNA-binding response OmpR family regulator